VVVEDRWVSSRATTSIGTPWRIMAVAWLWRSMRAVNPIPVRPVKLHVPPRAPRTLEAGQIVAILAACEHLRDRFLLSLLAETGMRVGQALGLHHCDFVSREREVHIVPRADNANGARAKVRSAAVVPFSAPLVHLFS